MKPRFRINEVLGKSMVRDFAELVSGTLIGRLIALAAMPFATRLYSPDDFASLAVYIALVGTISVAACMRLEIAIPLSKSDVEAANLLALSLLSTAIVTALALVATFLYSEQTGEVLGRQSMAQFLWLVPLGIFLAASYSALQFWATRARRFAMIAKTRITQAAMGASAVLGLGWLGLAPFGLLFGNAVSIGAGGFRLGTDAVTMDFSLFREVSWRSLGVTLRDYRRYPLFSTPEALANVAGTQIPIILIASYSGVEAGFLFLSMQLMTLPMSLLGSSISQVYMSRVQEEIRHGKLAPFTLSIMRKLAIIGGAAVIIFGAFAPAVVPFIFGDEWSRSGEIVMLMVPWIVLQFVVSPVSMSLHATGRQPLAFGLQVFGFGLRVGSVLFAQTVTPGHVIEVFSLASALFYAVYLICVLFTVRRR